MKYLDEYKNFVSTIKNPLEKLDDIETYMDAFESSFDQIEGNHEMGLISNKEYKILVKERDIFFKWGNEEITLQVLVFIGITYNSYRKPSETYTHHPLNISSFFSCDWN